MPRIQVFIKPELYPSSSVASRSDQQNRVANFLSGLPTFVSQTLGLPEERVRLFAAPMGEFDRSPVDVDVTTSIKFEPEEGLAQKNESLQGYADQQLGNGISSGSHLYLLPNDAWARTVE